MKSVFMAAVLFVGCASANNGQVAHQPSALALHGEEFRFDYGDFQADVSFTEDTVTWSDGRVTETDAVRTYTSTPGVHFVQWTEEDGTFVTLLIDLNEMKVHNSVLPPGGGEAWFSLGRVSVR